MRIFSACCLTLRRHFDRRIRTCGIAAVLASLATVGAQAQTCTVSMTAVAFGTVNVLPGTAVNTTATITVTCSGGSGNQRVCVSIGCGPACDSTSREMTSGSNTARYDLYSNSTRTTLWGSWHTGYDSAGVQMTVSHNSSNTHTVYARFLAAQPSDVPGAYTATFPADPFITYVNASGAPACPTGTLTASGTASVTATISSNCTISSTTVNFGAQGLLNANIDAQGTLSIQCSSQLPYAVSLDGGNSGATDPTQRKMTKGANSITYGLYRDAARSLAWGSTSGVNTASGTGSGTSQTLTVYGRVPPQTTPKANTYTDSIIATVTY
jgi:spore coat protein U-like protein